MSDLSDLRVILLAELRLVFSILCSNHYPLVQTSNGQTLKSKSIVKFLPRSNFHVAELKDSEIVLAESLGAGLRPFVVVPSAAVRPEGLYLDALLTVVAED